MSSLSRAIGEIQRCLATGNVTRTPEVEELARQYSIECRRIVDRLNRCDEYLGRGLISEAVQLSRAAPDLLEELALLEFAEKDSWEEILDLYQLPVPPKPLVHKAISINRAYSDIQEIEETLAKWRRANLGLAPLRKRIDLGRKLHKHDPNNITFKDNLADLESQRLEEMLFEARDATKRHDPFTHRSLLVELEDESNWAQAPDPGLTAEIRKVCGKAMENAARKEAQACLRELLEAFKHRDERRSRVALAEFDAKCQEARVNASDDMVQVALPCRRWIEDLDNQQEKRAKREQAMQVVWQAVQNPASTEEELIRHQEMLERNRDRYGSPDPGLLQALGARLDRYRRAEQAKESLIIGATVIVGTILIVSFLIFVIARSR